MLKQYTFPLFAAGITALLSAQAHTDTNACFHFHGVADLEQGLVLTATSNAPAGASGTAEFIAVDDNGTNYALLFVNTRGLTNGPYSVDVTDDTGTNTYDLGTLNVSTITNFRSDGDHHFRRSHYVRWGRFPDPPPAHDWTNWIGRCAETNFIWTNLFNLGACTNLHHFATNAYWWYMNTRTAGSGSFVLPAGLTETNAALITVSDTNGVVDLVGDFHSTTNSTVVYKEVADIIPGTATNAQGTATITYRLKGSRTVGTFRLQASGLPAREKLYLTANDTNTIPVFTRNNGTLRVRAFRKVDVATIQTVVATDTSSNVVFSVDF